MIKDLREDFLCVDIRGTIEERLKKLDSGEVDALVVAEAAVRGACVMLLILRLQEYLQFVSCIRRSNPPCLNACLNTCFPVSTLGVLTPVFVSQHLILNAKKCLNVKPRPLVTVLGPR